MSWQGWVFSTASVGLNLHAIAGLVLSRGKAAPVKRRWARRTGWLVLAFFGISTVVVAGLVRGGASALDLADPSMRAGRLAQQISEAINTIAFVVVASLLPIVATFWLGVKARRSEDSPG